MVRLSKAVAFSCVFFLWSEHSTFASQKVLQISAIAAAKHPPIGFQIFCLRYPEQCQSDRQNKTPNSQKLRSLLEKVNSAVNRSIRPQRESSDTWSLNPSAGDCEDYAITKRAKLIKQGVPTGALRLALVKTARGENHMVLFVKTSDGELVLDNLSSDILLSSQIQHKILSVSTANPLKWAQR